MWLTIKGTVAVGSGLGLAFYIPIRTRRIAKGWVPPNFPGAATDYPAGYARQSARFLWFCGAIVAVFLVLAWLETDDGDWVLDALLAATWLLVAAMAVRARRQLSRLSR